jgi:hypothetical protein
MLLLQHPHTPPDDPSCLRLQTACSANRAAHGFKLITRSKILKGNTVSAVLKAVVQNKSAFP